MTDITKLVVPVAGRGTRFLPETKAISKEMLPILNKPLIHYICDEAIQSGIKDIIFVISRDKTDILNYFKKDTLLEELLKSQGKDELYEDLISSNFEDLNICYVEQKDPRGLGHAINCAQKFIHDEPFAVSLPDEVFFKVPAIKSLSEDYTDGFVLSLQEVDWNQTYKYGVINYSDQSYNKSLFEVTDMIEKPKDNPPSNLAITGRYILDPRIFKSLDKEIMGVGGEIQLTDAIKDCMKSEKKKVLGKIVESVRFDCGNPSGWLAANNWMFSHLKNS